MPDRSPPGGDIDYIALMPHLARRFWGDVNQRLSNARELRFGTHGSKSVDLKNGTWFDHELKTGGGALDLIAHMLQLRGQDAVDWLVGQGYIPGRTRVQKDRLKSKIVAVYQYKDQSGERVLFEKVRYEPKRFVQRRAGNRLMGEEDWVWDIKGIETILYRAVEVNEAIDHNKPIFIVEGEKDVENLAKVGLIGTCNPEGSNVWLAVYTSYLHNAQAIIIADNDKPGRDHADHVARAIKGVVRSLRVLDLAKFWPECPEGGDVSDWLASGGTADRLVDLALQCPDQVGNELNGHVIPDVNELVFDSKSESPAPKPKPKTPIRLSNRDFLGQLVAPDYLVDGIMQRSFLYCLTAPSGYGKTAVALTLAASVALGQPVGMHTVRQGTVLYLAGENPDDVAVRQLAVMERFHVDDMPMEWISGRFSLKEQLAWLQTAPPCDLMVVDTFAAFFEGVDENSNTDVQKFALMLRGLTRAPGRPTVLVLAHPPKHAKDPESFIPRGGGAFLGEIDGNFILSKNDRAVQMGATKIRGPEFQPIGFELDYCMSPARDQHGRNLQTVVARYLAPTETEEMEVAGLNDENRVLIALCHDSNRSTRKIAEALGWTHRDGTPNAQRVQRILVELERQRFVRKFRRIYVATDEGRKIVGLKSD